MTTRDHFERRPNCKNSVAPILDRDLFATDSATGQSEQLARVCLVCRWRELPKQREQVCDPCEGRMERQLDLLRRVTDLLGVVARNEPTGAGELHLPILDLTLPARGWSRFDQQDEQIGDIPVSTRLYSWWLVWDGYHASPKSRTGREVWRIAGLLLGELPYACQREEGIADFASDLRASYASVRRALGRDLRPVSYQLPCPACGVAELKRYPGDWIECERCQRLWDDPNLEQIKFGEYLWARNFLAEGDPWKQLDSTQATLYAGVPLETLRQWVHRNRLSPIRPVPKIGNNLAPKFWLLEVDRCTARMEHMGRERARRVAARIAKQEAEQDERGKVSA